MLHFAYGSNMSRELMSGLCPSARPLGAARLEGWRYFITADGYASVAPAAGSVVHGILWRVTPRDLAALNAYENLDSGLYVRKSLSVRIGERRVAALIYIGRSRKSGRPRPGYQDRVVLPAAASWAFPRTYMAELARWSTARPGAGR